MSSKIDPLSGMPMGCKLHGARDREDCLPRYDGLAISGFQWPNQSAQSIHFVGGKGLHKLDDLAAYLHVADLDEGPVELKTFRTAAEFDGKSH